MELGYTTFASEDLDNLTKVEFIRTLKSNGYDKLKFLRTSLCNPEHVAAVQKHFSRNYMTKLPLKALFLADGALPETETEFNRFLLKILEQQISSLETLEFADTVGLTTKVCKKLNKWMKSKQVINFSLKHTLSSRENVKELFQVKPGEKEIRLKHLKLVDVKLAEGCFLSLANLTKLHWENSTPSDIVWHEFCSLVENTKSLKVLILHDNIKTSARGILLGNAIVQNKSIERLDLLKLDEEISVPMIKLIFQNESITQFNFRPAAFPCDIYPILSALREAIQSGKAPLTSLYLGRIPIPSDISALLDNKTVERKKDDNFLKGIVKKLNQGNVTKSATFKTTLIGSASDILFNEILNQPEIDPIFQERVIAGQDPVVLLKLDSESEITDNLVVGVGNSDQAHARMILHSLEQEVTDVIQAENDQPKFNENQNADEALTMTDIVRYQTSTGFANMESNPEDPLRVNNMWLGLNVGDIEVPFVHRAQESGGVYLASFLVSKMLYSDFAEELRKLTSLLHKAPDTVQVIFVGLFEESLSAETLQSFNFDLESLKRFVCNKIWQILPQSLRKKLGFKQNSTPQEDYILFLSCPLVQNSVEDLNTLWRTIDINLADVVNEVDARWYIILNKLRSPSVAPYSYAKYSKLSQVAKQNGVNDVRNMVKYFEGSGELLVVSAKPNEEANSLVVFDKLWLKSKLDPISSEAHLSKNSPHAGVWANMYRKTLWENEEEWVADILSKHAESLGLLIRLDEEGGWLLPYANANSRRTSLKKEKYINSKPLFWIEIPRHYRKLEVFRLFSTRLLKLLVDEKQLKEAKHLFWRDSTSMGYALQQTDDFAWARCDTSSNRILLGVPEPLIEALKSFVDPVKQALKETVNFMSCYSEESSVSNSKKDDQEHMRYPHLIFRLVGHNNEVIEQPYFNFEAETPPKELSAAGDHPFFKDVTLISFSKSPYVNFIASVLQLEGLSVDHKEQIAVKDNYKYRLLVVLLGDDEKESAKAVLRGRKEKFLVRSVKEKNLSFYKEVYNGCKSLENSEKPEAGLNELILDVLKELGYQ